MCRRSQTYGHTLSSERVATFDDSLLSLNLRSEGLRFLSGLKILAYQNIGLESFYPDMQMTHQPMNTATTNQWLILSEYANYLLLTSQTFSQLLISTAPKDRTKLFWFIVPTMIPVGMVILSVIHYLRKKRREVDEGEEDGSVMDSSGNSFES